MDNTSNIIKLHHLQQQEPEILPQTNLESSTMINQKFSNGVLIDSTTFKDPTSNTSTPVILTNFGAINSSNFQQQPTLQQQLQQNNNKPPSTLFLQINPNSHSSSLRELRRHYFKQLSSHRNKHSKIYPSIVEDRKPILIINYRHNNNNNCNSKPNNNNNSQYRPKWSKNLNI